MTSEAPAVVVPRAHAEAARRALRESGLLDAALQPMRDGGDVRFALRRDVDAVQVQDLVAPLGGRLTSGVFHARDVRPSSYHDLLVDLPDDARLALPSSFDIVGHVAILKLPDALLAHQARIGAAILQTHRNVATVALDKGVKGAYRIRDLAVIAGAPELATLHREHGIDVEVDLDKVYFSPRLATERLRLAGRVFPGDTLVDLFAGVGAFVVLAAKTRGPAAITAIDLNPDAVRLMERNLGRNHVPDGIVTPVCGDAREAAPVDGEADHVVMNLPHDAASFLDVAGAAVAEDGEVHLYAIIEREERDLKTAEWAATLTRLKGRPWRLVETRHVRTYSPTMDGWGFTFSGLP